MALSYYSNSESTQQLDSFCDSELLSFNDLFHPENPSFFLSNGVSYDHHHPISTEFQPFHYQKCDQIYAGNDHLNCPVFSHEYFPNPCFLQDYTLPEIPLPPLPEFPTVPPYDCVKSLSAQSIAARQRRRKITEKTQELGKIVPGGLKMNTAEMLQSAYKYVKFLQAQAALLEFISSFHQESAVEFSEDFQLLIESPLIQEKLYSTENCLIPQKFFEQICSDDEEFKTNTHCVKKEH